MANDDPIAKFKAAQRESWKLFAPLAAFTTPAAAHLVKFGGVKPGEAVLDLACGTGVVAVTAARAGARVKGLDLSPVLLEDACKNAAVINASIEFVEGDAEALPYKDGEFDVVLSQFGHMFAPRPDVVVREMLRVLKPGGRIAFSTWPPELMIGLCFATVGRYLPPPPPGVSPPPQWGDPGVIRERLGAAVERIEFHREELMFPALSPAHYRAYMELTAGPVIKAVDMLSSDPPKLAAFRGELEALAERYFEGNRVRQSFLMTRAVKV
ncbi:MAG: class I SAM-dependent methyltransferase [Nevskiaceae bacterium]